MIIPTKPWKITDGGTLYFSVVSGANDVFIAMFLHHQDAELFMAAPKMYAALQEIAEGPVVWDGEYEDLVSSNMETAQDALKGLNYREQSQDV